MWYHSDIKNKELHQKIRNKQIVFGGNINLKIFGTLSCKSGQRMQKKNRIFFSTANEAEQQHYRPCGHCMREDYKKWKEKNGLI
ncbi:metal-binding protein [Sphingobacteriaceae bacterium]|nr:metal-binding protein [Sphingobacteriaceae bacterium]